MSNPAGDVCASSVGKLPPGTRLRKQFPLLQLPISSPAQYRQLVAIRDELRCCAVRLLDCEAARYHNGCMDEAMKRKIDSVLERVKDPESDLPISRLGVIERLRYNEARQELYIFADFLSHQAGCLTCVGIAATVIDGIKRRLLAELKKEFPELTIMFV